MAKTALKGPAKISKIFIVDDHPIVLEGLSLQIRTQPDLEVCGEASDVQEALARVKSLKPDLVIVDLSLKTGSGIDLIKRIQAHDESIPILVCSMFSESLYAERAIRAGAKGYVHKGRALREIIDGIRALLAGKTFISPELSGELVVRLFKKASQPGIATTIESLSDREMETFRLLGQGLSTEAIAEKMHVSPGTIATYRLRIKEKLGLEKVSELIQRASQWNLENA
jgi:DNA-binding NarL/FixJ family response regulator